MSAVASPVDFSRLLNPEQLAAATAPDGPLLVLAAAGTGKTRTLVHRVAYLLEQGVPPDRILLLTFTNRAAREMRERAEAVVGEAALRIWSGTFHSICARLLRRYGSLLGYPPGFTILDSEDQRKIVGEIIRETVQDPKSFPKKEVVAKMISEAANEGKRIEAIAERWQTKVAGFEPEQIVRIAGEYEARKRRLGAMDFDDLLCRGLELLRTSEQVRTVLQEHFLHILVDEYQDTNGLQAEFTDLLAARNRNLMVVGDDYQCIYTWRGAQIENILDFPKRWPGCRIVKLERNYRSVPGILDFANAVMKDQHGQFAKRLRPFRRDLDARPLLCTVYDGRAQAQEICRMVREAHEQGYRYADMAVLYRSHYQSIDVQMAFAREQIPHRITSGVGVFEQAHAKDVLAFLRLLVNPGDELSFMRFVQLLPGVGEASAKKMWSKLGGRFAPLEPASRAALSALLGKKAKPLWPGIEQCCVQASGRLAANEPGKIVEDFLDCYYEDHLYRVWDQSEADDRLDDVRELAAQIGAVPSGLEGFLADVALMTNLDVRNLKGESDCVMLSTVHQAKGMEWPVVFLPWLSEGMFPSPRAEEEGRGDEELRLFYVAATRAKDRLSIFSPRIRKMADGRDFPVEPSVFVRGIPADLVEKRRIAGALEAYASQTRTYGGGYGGYGRGGGAAAPAYRTTWRR